MFSLGIRRCLLLLCFALLTLLFAAAPSALAIRHATRSGFRNASGVTVCDEASTQIQFPPLGTPIEKLKAVASGPGLVVCEPVVMSGSATLGDFGAGCGRWLHLVVGGQGAMEKTPLWSSLGRILLELHRADLRLRLPEAARLGKMLGITHVAVGTISGNAAQCKLTYRLWQLPSQKAVGAPLTVSGSPAQTLQQLPGLARTLSQRLGIAPSNLPVAVGVTPEEMSALGRFTLRYNVNVEEAAAESLNALVPRTPLAGVLLLNVVTTLNDSALDEASHSLLTSAPNNTLAISEIAMRYLPHLLPYRAQIERLRRRFPSNYLLNLTEFQMASSQSEVIPAGEIAERIVQNNMGSPSAWATLCEAVQSRAETVRRGRMFEEMSKPMQNYVTQLYPQSVKAAQRAVQLDPQYGHGWHELAVAATFAGNETLADQAFQNSLRYAGREAVTYTWGLQMYQPKWRDNAAAMLKRVARLAMAAHFEHAMDTLEVVNALEEAGFRDLAKKRLEAFIQENTRAVQGNPKDVLAYWGLGHAYKRQGKFAESIAAYRMTTTLRPNNGNTFFDLGVVLIQSGHRDEAIPALRDSVRLYNDNGAAHAYLAGLLVEKKLFDAALPEVREALRIDSGNSWAYTVMSQLMIETKQYAAAIEAGRKAVALNYYDARAHATLGNAYLLDHQVEESVEQFREAIQIAPNFAWAKQKLDEALKN